MEKRKLLIIMTLLFAMVALSWGIEHSILQAADGKLDKVLKYHGKITPADRKAAADRAKAKGLTLTDLGIAQMAMPGDAPHYFSHPNYANSPLPIVTLGACSITTTTPCTADTDCLTGETCIGYSITGGMKKFVNGLPGLRQTGANTLGQYISVAVPDTTTYPGADYYEIAVVEYTEQMHSDLPPTRLRGYVQLDTSVVPGAQVLSNLDDSPILMPDGSQAVAVDIPRYLGPTIIAQKD